MIEISAIKLPESFKGYKNIIEENADFLEPISKINIFVGANNSGKSRFMRSLSSWLDYEIKMPNLENINSIIRNSLDNIQQKFKELKITLIQNQQPSNHWAERDLSKSSAILSSLLSSNRDKYSELRSFVNHWSSLGHIETTHQLDIPVFNKNALKSFIQSEIKQISDALGEIPIIYQDSLSKRVYIPTLRGLRHLNNDISDFYEQKTRKDYFDSQSTHPSDEAKVEASCPKIFTGLTLFQRVTDLLLGNNSERKLISKYQEFISEKLFEGKPIALIPKQKEKVVVVKIGNETEQPIHLLGDGIQSAIILTFLPFLMQEQTFFFIEEPEMYLHPGLQRKILEFYNSLEQHTFFMTTHSNHFLDITIDIKNVSIFTFRKFLDETKGDDLTPEFTFEAVDSGCQSSLELLGVRNSSVFLVNATIWVEGITDRWYLRQMLESYIKHLENKGELKLKIEEDTHYSFVEYGGANITHWSFLDYEEKPIEVKTLCGKAIVIIDKDGEKKEQRKEDLVKFLDDRLIILPCREVENLLPYSVIKEVVKEYEKNHDLKLPEFAYEKYKDKYLGTFIESQMLKNSFTRKGGYKSDSGTLKDKVKFCEKALPKIEFEKLPESTQEIIENIYNFIRKQNSNKSTFS